MVYLLLGQEEFLKKQALDKIRAEAFAGGSWNLNCEEFQAGEDDLNKITDCAKTAPFMGKFRLLLVNNVDRLDPQQKETLASFILSMPSSAIMVLAADSLSISDVIYQAAAKNGILADCNSLQDNALYKWIYDRCRHFNKRIQPDAIRAIADNIGNDLMQLGLAIELVAIFAGDADTIKLDDVERMTGKSLEAVKLKLFETIGHKDAAAALGILKDLGKDAHETAKTIGLIRWHLWRIWRMKRLVNKRVPMGRSALSVGVRQREAGDFLKQTNNFSRQELEKDFKLLLRLDKDRKTTTLRANRALELLVMQFCAASS